MPSHTGEEGGNQTGYKMSHFVLTWGLYEKSFSELEKLGGKISWIESIGEQKKNTIRKRKYIGRQYNIKLWGKSKLNIVCRDCEIQLEELV